MRVCSIIWMTRRASTSAFFWSSVSELWCLCAAAGKAKTARSSATGRVFLTDILGENIGNSELESRRVVEDDGVGAFRQRCFTVEVVVGGQVAYLVRRPSQQSARPARLLTYSP